ncbi:MAG: hypothetical protein AAF657_09340 [Acidobacteriota bacterium]
MTKDSESKSKLLKVVVPAISTFALAAIAIVPEFFLTVFESSLEGPPIGSVVQAPLLHSAPIDSPTGTCTAKVEFEKDLQSPSPDLLTLSGKARLDCAGVDVDTPLSTEVLLASISGTSGDDGVFRLLEVQEGTVYRMILRDPLTKSAKIVTLPRLEDIGPGDDIEVTWPSSQ